MPGQYSFNGRDASVHVVTTNWIRGMDDYKGRTESTRNDVFLDPRDNIVTGAACVVAQTVVQAKIGHAIQL